MCIDFRSLNMQLILNKRTKTNTDFRNKMNRQEKRICLTLTDSQINILAGAASGVAVSILVSPFDVIKTRTQVQRSLKGVPDTPLLVTIYRWRQQEGFRAFYKGLGTTMLVR